MLIAAASLAACSIHRLDIQQGTVLDDKAISRIETGMTPRQVVFLLGPPPIRDPFHAGRWDYVEQLVTADGIERRYHLVLFFENGRLARFERRAP